MPVVSGTVYCSLSLHFRKRLFHNTNSELLITGSNFTGYTQLPFSLAVLTINKKKLVLIFTHIYAIVKLKNHLRARLSDLPNPIMWIRPFITPAISSHFWKSPESSSLCNFFFKKKKVKSKWYIRLITCQIQRKIYLISHRKTRRAM